MKREEKRKKTACVDQCADMRADKEINTDPMGMWTGVPTDAFDDEPIQDVDDL